MEESDQRNVSDSVDLPIQYHHPEADRSVLTTVPHNPTPCLESLSEDLARMMDQGSDRDVEFQCGGQTTRAHKSIVCARSQVLASMLSSDMVEGRTGVVKVPDMQPDIFQKFLRYLYTGRLDALTYDVALALYEAGDQYSVLGLARRCGEYLMEHLSTENACEVLVVLDAHGDSKNVESVMEYMHEKKLPVVSDCWSAFSDEHPRLSNKVLLHSYKKLLDTARNGK